MIKHFTIEAKHKANGEPIPLFALHLKQLYVIVIEQHNPAD